MKYSTDFLTRLSVLKHQTKYARITALNINEEPLESFEGVITGGGPISIDGASAVRRTCSLTVVAKEGTAITDPYWALTNKFKVEIGLKNTIDPSYPDIIWLNQGIYVINQFSISENATSKNISISGQDKMTKLNGTLGGLFPVQTTLDTLEEVQKDGSVKYTKIPIYHIIKNMLHELAQEPFHNIIIEDLPEYGYELWNYMGVDSGGNEMPMYVFREVTQNGLFIRNITFDGDKMVYRLFNPSTSQVHFVVVSEATGKITIVNADGASVKLTQEHSFMLKEVIDSDLYNKTSEFETGTSFALTKDDIEGRKKYKIQKIRQGDIAGYHKTDLIYPGDLVAAAGETIVSVLDKIKNLLGEFEYYYDIDGKFHFKKKQTYVNGLFSPINGDTVEPFVAVSQYSYKFENKELLTSISHSPSIGDVKNDFTIWGNKRSSAGGDKLPIHARFAIDKKPERYTTFPYYRKCFDMFYIGDVTRAFERIETKNDEGEVIKVELKENSKPANALKSFYLLEINPDQLIKAEIEFTDIEKEVDEVVNFIQEDKYKVLENLGNQKYKCLNSNDKEIELELKELIDEYLYKNDIF